MRAADRPEIERILLQVGNFNPAETACALELVDIYLNDKQQGDYRLVVAEDDTAKVRGYACWGPTPLTRGTYDLYWIATDPEVQGAGFGRVLMAFVYRGTGAKGKGSAFGGGNLCQGIIR